MDADNKKRKSRFFPGFLLGLIVGGLAVVLTPSWWETLVPDSLFPQETVSGLVLQKDRESGRLLVKLETGEGVLLATFTERQDAIDLLVEAGDSVTLRVPRYEPFLTDPRLERVRKSDTSKEVPTSHPEETGAGAKRPEPDVPAEAPEPEAPSAAPQERESTTTTTTTPPSSR
jgi:hypothetical protein